MQQGASLGGDIPARSGVYSPFEGFLGFFWQDGQAGPRLFFGRQSDRTSAPTLGQTALGNRLSAHSADPEMGRGWLLLRAHFGGGRRRLANALRACMLVRRPRPTTSAAACWLQLTGKSPRRLSDTLGEISGSVLRQPATITILRSSRTQVCAGYRRAATGG